MPSPNLLEKHPGRIPAKIMALCPGDAWQAFNVYISGLKRGYLKGVGAAIATMDAQLVAVGVVIDGS